MLRTDSINNFSAMCGLKVPDEVRAVGEFFVFFGGRVLQMTVKNIISSEQAVVKLSMEAKGTIGDWRVQEQLSSSRQNRGME